MANVDSYMMFQTYDKGWLKAESQVKLETTGDNAILGADFKDGQVFEVETFNFDLEQTLNIGSQSKGAGAGKVTFNAFNITRKIDLSSPTIFNMACSGTSFKQVSLGFRKSAGGDQSGVMFLRFDFKLVAVKTISWEHDEESPKETMAFEYGGLFMRYCPQKPDGHLEAAIGNGWNRVTNRTLGVTEMIE